MQAVNINQEFDDIEFDSLELEFSTMEILTVVKEYLKPTIIPSQTVDFLVGLYYKSGMRGLFLKGLNRFVALRDYCQNFINNHWSEISILIGGSLAGALATIMLLVSVIIIGSTIDTLEQVKKGKKLSRAEAHRRISKKGFSDSLAYEVSDIYAKYF